MWAEVAWGEQSQVCTLTPNFSIAALKMWALSPKIAKLLIFGINLPHEGISP